MIDKIKEQLEDVYEQVRAMRAQEVVLKAHIDSLKFDLAKERSTITAFVNSRAQSKPTIIENPVNCILQAENACLRDQIKQLENLLTARNEGWLA